jgi:hypothetical protein
MQEQRTNKLLALSWSIDEAWVSNCCVKLCQLTTRHVARAHHIRNDKREDKHGIDKALPHARQVEATQCRTSREAWSAPQIANRNLCTEC